MLLVAVFNSAVTGIAVRSIEFELTLKDLPTMAFHPTEELVKTKEFKTYVVKLLLGKFPHEVDEIHTAFIVWNDKVIRRWRASRGHFREISTQE
jgi:hypothetical protein